MSETKFSKDGLEFILFSCDLCRNFVGYTTNELLEHITRSHSFSNEDILVSNLVKEKLERVEEVDKVEIIRELESIKVNGKA